MNAIHHLFQLWTLESDLVGLTEKKTDEIHSQKKLHHKFGRHQQSNPKLSQAIDNGNFSNGPHIFINFIIHLIPKQQMQKEVHVGKKKLSIRTPSDTTKLLTYGNYNFRQSAAFHVEPLVLPSIQFLSSFFLAYTAAILADAAMNDAFDDTGATSALYLLVTVNLFGNQYCQPTNCNELQAVVFM